MIKHKQTAFFLTRSFIYKTNDVGSGVKIFFYVFSITSSIDGEINER